jgi:hypothetical protein
LACTVVVRAVGIKPCGQPVGLPCGDEGAVPLQSFAMIGIWLAKPIRLAATMIAPGIQSLRASTMIPKLASIAAVDALHIYPLGAESATRDIAAAFRTARGAPAYRH